MNTDIFNYLGFFSEKLANLYKSGRFNPLPASFSISKTEIKERLIFSQIEPKFPDFVFNEKKKIKNYFKVSQKNIKNLLKITKKIEKNSVFSQKINFYLILRLKLTEIFLKQFKNQDFNELSAMEQIFKLDPVFFEILGDMFDENFELTLDFDDLSKTYSDYYLKITKFFEKKNNKQTKTILHNLETTSVLNKDKPKTQIKASQKKNNKQKHEVDLKKEQKISTKSTKNIKNKEI